MANFFDQFDDKPAATGGNFFDQFDEPAEEGPVGPSGPQSRGLARARKLRSPSMATAVRDQIFGPGWGKTLTEDVPTTVRGGLAAMVAGTKLKALQELQEAKSATDPASLRRDSSLEEAVARERGVVREAMGDMRGAREGSNFMQGAVQTAAMSLAQSSGALGVGLLTRSPWLAAAAMYPSTEGLKYGQLDEMGMQDPAAKRKFAAVEGMLEVGTELAPFDALLKSGSDPLQRVAQFLIRELPGESIATLTQGANDHIAELYAQGKPVNALDVAEGLLKASKDLPETWVSTVLAGGLQSGAVSLAEMPARRQADRQYDLNLSRQSVDALNPANAQMEMRPVAPEGETLADAVTPEQVWDRNPPEQVVPDMQYTVENPLPEANFFDQFDEPTTVAAQPVAPEETSTTPPPAGDRTPQAAPTTSQPETKITFSTDKDINDAYEAAVEKSAEVPESLRVTPDRAGVRSFRETVYERRNMLDGFQRSLISRQGPPTDNRQWPKNPELKNILRGWGLPVGGNRDELITRIREAHLTAFGAYRNEDLNDLTLKVLKPMAESLGIKHQYMNKAQIVGELQFKLRGMRASVIEQANRESYQRDIQNYLRVRRGPLTKEEYTFLLNESGIPREQFDTQLKQKGLYPREMEAQRRELEEMQRRSKAAPIPPAGTTGQFGESTVEVLGPAEPDAQGHPQVRVKITSEFKRGSELTIRASTFLPKEKETPEPAPMVEHQQRRAANARMKLREILQDGVESVPTDPEAFAKWWAGDRFKSADGGVHTSQALLDFGSQFEQMVQSAYGAQFIIDGRKDAPNFYEAPVDYIEYWSKKIDAHVEAQTAETTDALEWALSESEVKSEFEDPDTAKMGLTVAEGGMHTLDAELRSGKIVYALKAQPHSTAVVDETKKRKKGEPPVYITFDSYDAAITELTKRAAAWNADPENARMDELVESETMDRDVRDVDARPIFPPPDKTTRAADALKGTEFLTQKEADALVEEWKAAAKAAGSQEDNSKKVVISLFDHSGVWSQPWVDAGYTVIRSDLKRGDDLMQSNPAAIAADLKASGMRVVGVLAAPPCTSFAGSGAGWWQQQHDVVSKDWVRKKYGDFAAEYFDRPLDYAVAMVRMAEQYVEQTDPVFYAFENPVGRVQRMADLPDPTLIFQPHHYGDPSTKRTMLWGEFNPDLPTANVRPKESKAHKLRGDDPKQKALRSLTPEGFAYAFFVANHGATAETQTAEMTDEEYYGDPDGDQVADIDLIDEDYALGEMVRGLRENDNTRFESARNAVEKDYGKDVAEEMVDEAYALAEEQKAAEASDKPERTVLPKGEPVPIGTSFEYRKAPTDANPVNNKPLDPDTPGEQRLICLACSGTKKDLPEGAKAIDLYDGPMYQSLRVALDKLPPEKRPRVVILSAKHGWLNANDTIKPYDERMTSYRADELIAEGPAGHEKTRRSFAQSNDSRIPATEVMLAGSGEYRRVFDAVVWQMMDAASWVHPDASVHAIGGRGIGDHRRQLTQWVLGETETDQGGELASRAPGGTMPEPMLAPAPVLPLPGTTPLQRIAGERAAGIEQKYQKLTLKYPALKPAGRDVPLGASNYDTLWTEMVRRRDGETDSEFEARQKAFAQRMRTAGAAAQWKAARSFVLTRFGFNDVVMDKEADVRESLDALLDAFNNLDTHAAVLGLPRAAVGLNRQLTLRLTKTLGNRYTLGMFSWGSMGGRDGIPVVSIARRNDSFTHEWAHAFDHWLMKLAGVESGALTTQIVGKSLGDVAALKEAMPEIHARFRELMQTIFYDLTNEQVTELEKYMAEIAQYKEDIAAESNADVVKKLREEIEAYNARIQQILDSSKTPFLQGSEMQDALAGVEYYSMPAEMLARAVQRYMSNMVNQWKGTEFITDPPPLYPERRTRQDTVMPERDMTENPGLSEHEARIAIAIRNLMGAVAGANVFRDTGPAAQRRDADALSANNLLTEVEVAARQIPELTFLQRVVARTREDIEGLTRATLAMRDKLKKLVSSPKASAVQLLEIANMLPKALGNGMLYSGRGMLLGLIGKYKGNAALQSELRLILNKVATDPGSGTYQGWQDERGNIQNDMDTAVERKTKARLNMEARIRKVHGIDDTDETQMQQLRDMLTRPTEALITSQRVALQNAEDRMADIVKSIAALTDQQRQVFEDIESALKDPRLDPNSKEENETWIREQKAYFAQRRAALQSARDQLAWDIKLGRERLELLQATDAVVDAKLDEVDVAIRMLESSNTLEEGIQRLRALADRAYDATTGAGKGRRKALREYADLAAKMGAAAQSAGVTDAAEIINVALDTLKAQQSRLNIEVERRKGLADLKKIPENVKKAAVAYRAMLDKLRYEGIDAGISLGYVPNGYLPRKYDEVKIDDNQEKFLDQAAKTYRDGILQEREFLITYISDLIAQQERLAGEKQERVAYGDRSFNRDAQLRDLAQRINKMKARLKELESESPKELAESFLLKALHNDFGDFGGLTPPRDFTRRRKLPPSADTFLAEFMETNPVHLIQQYIQRATRRQEYARRFGQDGEILEMHRLKLLAAGMERGDFSIVDRALQIATGSFRPYAGQGNTALGLTNRFVDYVYHRAMMVLLVRASFPSLTEGAIVGMRTKSMKDSAKGLAEHYRLLFGQHPDQRDLYELARLEGIIGDALTEQAVHNRMLLMEGDKTFDRSQLATYFTATMLHRITVSNRVMSMRLMQFHVETWVDRYLAPQSAEEKAAAESEMNEWGIPPEKRQEFAQWVKDHGGVVDADSMLEDVEDSWQQVYADVLYRLVDQTQMNPKSMDRPVGAFNPVGRFVLSITGFNWTFQRNVLIRTGKDIMRHQGDSAKQTALMRTLVAAQYVGPAMLLILMGQILQSMRDWYDDPTGEKFERRIENAEDHPFLAMLNAISRAGGFGGWDPVYQLVPQLAYPEGYKWRRRLGDTFVGAIPGWFLTQLNDIWDGLTDIVTDQTPNSNFAERRMWKAIYNLTFAWTIVGVVARHRIPGFLGFLLATQSTSAAARNTFAEFMAPKTEQELKREKQRQARRNKSESGSKVL